MLQLTIQSDQVTLLLSLNSSKPEMLETTTATKINVNVCVLRPPARLRICEKRERDREILRCEASIVVALLLPVSFKSPFSSSSSSSFSSIPFYSHDICTTPNARAAAAAACVKFIRWPNPWLKIKLKDSVKKMVNRKCVPHQY